MKDRAPRMYTAAPFCSENPEAPVSAFSTAFVGAGNMAGSIIGGLLAAGFKPAQIRASDPSAEHLARLRARGIERLGPDNAACVRGAEVVVLAVKPQVLTAVCEPLAPVLKRGQLVVSIAAGVAAHSLRARLGPQPTLVRCMPNTAALVRSGASALYACGPIEPRQRQRAQTVLEAVGVARWVQREEQLHAVTALSGSGPAYFFQLMEAMIAEGQRMGLDAETARILCAQTCMGAGRMLGESARSAAELRRQVCSPGGTTERALAAFSAGDLNGLVARAMRHCHARSAELAAELA